MEKNPSYDELLQRIIELEGMAEKLNREKESLLANSTYLQAILDNTDLPIFLKDADLNYLMINCQFENLSQWKNTDIRGKNDFDVFPDPVARLFRSQDEEVVKNRSMADFTETIPLPDGIHTFITSKFPVFDPNGKLFAVGGVCTDITELKAVHETLKKYEDMVSASMDHMSFLDRDYIYRAVNDAYLDAHDRKREDIVGRSVPDLMGEDVFRSLIKNNLDKALAGEPVQYEAWFDFPKHGRCCMEVRYFPSFDHSGSVQGVVVNSRSITERKLAEEALKESEQKYGNVFQYASDGIALIDLEGNVLEANRKLQELTGYSEEDMIGLSILDLHPAGTRAQGKQLIQDVHDSGFVQFELMTQRKDGTLFPAEVSASLLDIGEQQLIHGILRDISDRKKFEEELLKVQKLESTGILAGGIAHDFNNLLTAIMGNISLAKIHAKDDGIIHSRLAGAESAAVRAQGLTQQLLTFSKGGAPVKRSISAAELIKDNATFILSGSNVSCDVSFAEDLWPVMADEGQIGQVIQNVVKNADQAMPDGGSVYLKAENMTVRIKNNLPLKEGRYVKVTIRDHGIGISDEHIAKVFDPYFSTKQQGNGLGLASAYSIIKNHDGLITVESDHGKGSSFIVYLPAADHAPVEDNVQKDISPGNGERILIMDDELYVLEVAEAILKSIGYEVAITRDGTEAIKLYRNALNNGHPFDAVILDLTVAGGMGGLETVKELLHMDPDVKTIVSSGYAVDPIMANYADHGFSDVVIKPYGVDKLSTVLRRLLGQEGSGLNI